MADEKLIIYSVWPNDDDNNNNTNVIIGDTSMQLQDSMNGYGEQDDHPESGNSEVYLYLRLL